MAIGVLRLMLSRPLRETEDSPVTDAADSSSGSEDEGAGSAGNSGFDQYAMHLEEKRSCEAHSLTSKRLPGRTWELPLARISKGLMR